MFEKNETYRRVKNELLGSIIIAILAAFFCILVYSFSSNDVLYSNKGILFLGFLFICGIALLGKGEKFMNAMHRDFGLKR